MQPVVVGTKLACSGTSTAVALFSAKGSLGSLAGSVGWGTIGIKKIAPQQSHLGSHASAPLEQSQVGLKHCVHGSPSTSVILKSSGTWDITAPSS
ncbi:hypothetical protein FKM82_026556 [Ascaphus truei]